jgi:hypothetical protein
MMIREITAIDAFGATMTNRTTKSAMHRSCCPRKGVKDDHIQVQH